MMSINITRLQLPRPLSIESPVGDHAAGESKIIKIIHKVAVAAAINPQVAAMQAGDCRGDAESTTAVTTTVFYLHEQKTAGKDNK
jgi:hypothetical protein